MTDGKCSCGVPSEADVYIEGVIGRGTEKTGTETEELSEFRCKAHAQTRPQYSRMLRQSHAALCADSMPEDELSPTAEWLAERQAAKFYGPWQVLEWKRHKLKVGK